MNQITWWLSPSGLGASLENYAFFREWGSAPQAIANGVLTVTAHGTAWKAVGTFVVWGSAPQNFALIPRSSVGSARLESTRLLIEGSWVRLPAGKLQMVFVAQLDRVPDCGSGGHEFDSHQTPIYAPVE